MRGALVVAAKDLHQRFRDRSALVLGFVAPLVLVVLMGSAFGGADDFSIEVGLVDGDGGPAGVAIAEGLSSPELADVVEVVRFDSVGAARNAVADDEVDAALVVPAGLSAMAAGGPEVPLEVLTSVDRDIAGEVTASIASSFSTRLATARLATAVLADLGVDAPAEAGFEAAGAEPLLVAVPAELGSEPLEGVAYFGPAMGMFFVLFAVGFTARSTFQERASGTFDRLVASPIRPEAVLVGKALSVFVYACASLTTMAVFTAVVLGASWGSPLGVLALIVAMATAVVALALLVVAVARTERQADALASMLTFALALVGGSFLFLGTAPLLLRRLALLTPNGWALRGFTDLATGVDTWSAVAEPVAGIAAFTVVVGAVAVAVGRGGLER